MWHKQTAELIITINSTTLSLSLHNKKLATLSLERHEMIDGMIYKFTRIITFINESLKKEAIRVTTMSIILQVDLDKVTSKKHRIVLQYLLLSKEINITMTGIYLVDPHDEKQNLLSLFTPSTTGLKKWSTLGSLIALVLLVPLAWLVTTHQKSISNQSQHLSQCNVDTKKLAHNQEELSLTKQSLSLLEAKNKKVLTWHTSNQSIIKTIASTAQTIPNSTRLETLDIQATTTPAALQSSWTGIAPSVHEATHFHHKLATKLETTSLLLTTSYEALQKGQASLVFSIQSSAIE